MFLKSTVYISLFQRAEPPNITRMNCVTVPAVYYKRISAPEEQQQQQKIKKQQRTEGSVNIKKMAATDRI